MHQHRRVEQLRPGMCGTIVTADADSGRATAVERICVMEADLPGLQANSSA
jgi:hypothetical protein